MLDNRLKQPPAHDIKNAETPEPAFAANPITTAFNGETPESARGSRALESKLPPEPKPKSSGTFGQRLRRGWEDLSLRNKLALLLVSSAAIPVIIVIQALEGVAEDRLSADYEASLKQELSVLDDAVESVQDINKVAAASIAKSARSSGIDLNNSQEVSAKRKTLEAIAEDPSNDLIGQSFHIITDAQGRTVTQYIETLKDPNSSSGYSVLPPEDAPLFKPNYQLLSLQTGIPLGDIPIVKNALSSGQPLAGLELLNAESLQRLGLDKQANIGIRKQKTEGLPEPKKPFPEGTYDVDQGKAGLVLMAVNPIEANGRRVGTAMVGTLLNRNYLLVDKVQKEAGVATATLFAQDWRVSTNVPYTDQQTRAIGTRVSREVAETVLNQGKTFLGEANIVGIDYITGYSPLYDHQKQLNPSQAKPVGIAYVGEPKTQLQQTLSNLRLTGYGIGGGMLLLAGLVALPLAGTFARPIRRLSGFAQQVGAGEQGVRLEATERQDEIGVLSQEMNKMAASIETNLETNRQQADRVQLFADITASRATSSADLQEVADKAVQGARKILNVDRVVIYRFNPGWRGYISAEAVLPGWPKALANEIGDPCISQDIVEAYRQGRVVPTNDVLETGYSPEHMQLLERLQVKANLVTPVLQNEQLFGLLVAHHCSETHVWQQPEIDFLTQLAAQVSLSLDRAGSLEQITATKDLLQRRALELLMEVDPVSRGDLTIRANVTEDEIGTVADSYNATIASLRQIVAQVQTAAQQMAATTTTSEASVQGLSTEALRQTEEVTAALDQIQGMSNSIRAVAASAKQAEAAVKQANQTVDEGDAAMNRTVDGILAIRETVAETSTKVKRLGESTEKISQVVNLISAFADQTNLLALNASIEAARAGEQGRGFAVVADEVGTLARQSADATVEIEKLVADIQAETNEVAAAMEEGTQQVIRGTKLVDETRQSLNKITAVSTQIGGLVVAIGQAAIAQSKASESVTQTMTGVAAIAGKTSTEANQVSASFKDLLAVAQELQTSAGQFKVS